MHLSLLSASLLAAPLAAALPAVLPAPLLAARASNDSSPYDTKPLVPAVKLGAGADPSTASRNRTIGHFPRPAEFVEKPTYATFSAFDYQSIALGVHQEYIELDYFSNGLARFTDAQLAEAGLDAELKSLIEFFAKQEVGHALVLSNMLGESAPKPCNYKYPFSTPRQFIDVNVDITRFGEDGVLGFLPSLDNRAVAQILLQSITTESRQQLQFRQLLGLPSMVESFETGLPQTWAWTLLSEYIESCPASNAPVQWDIYPQLRIGNDPNQTALTSGPAIYTNVTALSAPGRSIELSWDEPGKTAGPYNQTTYKPANGTAKYAAFVSQYNVTYVPLADLDGSSSNKSATATQPGGIVLPQLTTTEIFNNTIYIAITDDNPFLTPLNLSLINAHVVAGPALYHSG